MSSEAKVTINEQEYDFDGLEVETQANIAAVSVSDGIGHSRGVRYSA